MPRDVERGGPEEVDEGPGPKDEERFHQATSSSKVAEPGRAGTDGRESSADLTCFAPDSAWRAKGVPAVVSPGEPTDRAGTSEKSTRRRRSWSERGSSLSEKETSWVRKGINSFQGVDPSAVWDRAWRAVCVTVDAPRLGYPKVCALNRRFCWLRDHLWLVAGASQSCRANRTQVPPDLRFLDPVGGPGGGRDTTRPPVRR